MTTGAGGGTCWPGRYSDIGAAGRSRDTWNVGCIFIVAGRSSRYAWEETFLATRYGPMFFQSSFFEARFVRMLRASSQTSSPTSYAGAGERFLLAYSC